MSELPGNEGVKDDTEDAQEARCRTSISMTNQRVGLALDLAQESSPSSPRILGTENIVTTKSSGGP